MTEEKVKEKSWLSYLSLSDYYERKARFIPGLLSFIFLMPASATFADLFVNWIEKLTVGLGIGSVIAVGISHLASAAGNRFQEKLWPRWPHDSPTNKWLNPYDNSRSRQQKDIWYAAIKRLTGLDIKAKENSNKEELEAIINDAVSTLRYQLRNSEHADRLRIHNADYGFARNFAGLRSYWLSFAAISFISNWIEYLWFDENIIWCIISSAIMLFSFLLAFKILPYYVRIKAKHYAESFFGAMIDLDRSGK